MLDCEIIHEAGPGWTNLALEIMAAVHETAPLVEKATGLPLGDHATIRLTTPSGLARANREHMTGIAHRLIERAPDDLDPIFAKMINKGMPLIGGAIMGYVMWPCIGGQYLPGTGPYGEIVIVPRALKGIGITPRTLRMIISHELTHMAQFRAGPDILVDSLIPMVTNSGAPSSEFSALVEGHAQWSQVRVTEMLYGTPLRSREEGDPKPSLRTQLTGLLTRKLPPLAKKRGDYTRGEAFTRILVDHGGTSLVNKIWPDTDLFPTCDEVSDPGLWLARAA